MSQLSFLTYLRGIYKINLNKSGKVHHAIIQSIYDCFVMAREDIDLARLEMCLSTATGYWLDCWGEYFGVFRKSGETDDFYCKRIIKEVISPKCTIPAIKDYIVDFLNENYDKSYTREDVLIREPWKEVAKYSHKGALSKDARFCSGDYWCHAVLDINIPEEVTKELIDLVNAVKAAGVKVIWSILNSYDIVGGFNTADDAWAAYHRWIQTQTYRHQNTGFMLSYAEARLSGNEVELNGTPHCISGSRQIWSMVTSLYQWYAKIQDKKTDESIIITKKDLIGLVDYYRIIETKVKINSKEKLRVSDDGTLSVDKKMSGVKTQYEEIERLVYIGDEVLQSLEFLDTFLTLSYQGRLSTDSGVMFNYTTSHDIFGKIMKELELFKQRNPDYYNAVQPPILNGERAMWLVARNKNWLWNTPTMTHEDFYKLWEPYGGREEHTLESIAEFEDAYYQGYITFGDQYQPPIVIGKPFRWTPKIHKEWMFNSQVFQNTDMEQLYVRKFYAMGTPENNDAKMGEIMIMEEEYSDWGYSTVEDEQPPIEHHVRKAARCTGIKILSNELLFMDTDIGKKFSVEYEVSPSNTTDYITFESSDSSVATIDEDGVITIQGVGGGSIVVEDGVLILQSTKEPIGTVEDGVLSIDSEDIEITVDENGVLTLTRTEECIITVTCGKYSDSVSIVVEKTEVIEPEPTPEPPEKVVLLENYTPNGEEFMVYNGEFNPKEQTLYAEILLDNMTLPLQNALSIGTNIASETLGNNIHLMYPKVENVTEERVVVDTSDNMKLNTSILGGSNGLLSGSESSVEQYYVKHEVDVTETILTDDEDNLHLSKMGKTMNSDKGMLSGSNWTVKVTETILEPVHVANFNVANKTLDTNIDTEFSGNLIKIAMNTYGYYINGKSLKDLDSAASSMVAQIINAIKQNNIIQIGSKVGERRSYATYNEVSILNHVALPSEMIGLTSEIKE